MKDGILRLLTIVFGYLVASLVTGYVVYAALLLFPSGVSGQNADAGGFAFGLMVAYFVAMFAAFPATLVIAAAEFRAWRMWWYYAIAGSLIGLALGTLFSPPPWFPWLGLGFGPVSGLIYWGIAGRAAGLPDRNPRISVGVIMTVVALVLLLSTWIGFFGAFF